MVPRKFWAIWLGLCFCLQLFLPGLVLAEHGCIGGNDVDNCEAVIDEVIIYDSILNFSAGQGYLGEGFEGIVDEVIIYDSILNFSAGQGYLGGEGFQGGIDEVCFYDRILEEGFEWNEDLIAIVLTPSSMGWKVSERDNFITFTVQVISLDPDYHWENDEFDVSFQINNEPMNYFSGRDLTAGGSIEVLSGSFMAKHRHEYEITMNNLGTFLPQMVKSFELRVEAKDRFTNLTKKSVVVEFTSLSGNIIAHWPLDTIKDGVTIDVSGSNNHGEVLGSRLTAGVSGNGMYFAGTDCVKVPLASGIDITTGDFSVEAWVKPEGNEGLIVGNHDVDAWPHWMLMLNQGRLGVSINAGSGAKVIKTSEASEKNRWYHVVGVREKDDVSLYVNGEFVAKMSGVRGNVNSEKDVYLGSDFKGCLDEVRIYGRALTEAEIRNNYRGVTFVDKIEVINKHESDDPFKHPCTFGRHETYLEFELQKQVEQLEIELELPSSVELKQIGPGYKKSGSKYVESNLGANMVDNLITFGQLDVGEYRLEVAFEIGQKLVIKAKTYQDERGIKINCEKVLFEFEFLDFESLPQIK